MPTRSISLSSGRPWREQAADRAGAVGVGADAVVGRADDAQAGVPPLAHLFRRQHRVGPFHAQDEAERLAAPRRPAPPRRGRGRPAPAILDPSSDVPVVRGRGSRPSGRGRRRRRLPSTRSAGWPASRLGRSSRASSVAMKMPTRPRRSSGNDTVPSPRPLSVMPCSASRRRMSAAGRRRSRFQSRAFQARSRCASKISMFVVRCPGSANPYFTSEEGRRIEESRERPDNAKAQENQPCDRSRSAA